MKACNTWLKRKKDKYIAGHLKTHFQTRWDKIKDLATAAHSEVSAIVNLGLEGDLGRGRIEYERKKLRRISNRDRIGNIQISKRSLQGSYGNEREMWLESNKTSNPVSATTLHEVIEMVTAEESMVYNAWANQEFGGYKVFGKDFDAMSTKDWYFLDRVMLALEPEVGTLARHVLFLKKSDRMSQMAIPNAQGKLAKVDGSLWDLGGWDTAYAMDEYGNLFIGQGLGTNTDRFNHSTLLGGKDVLCAGTLKIRNGQLFSFNNNSGHYKPTGVHVYKALLALGEDGVDLSQTLVTIVTTQGHGFGDLTPRVVIQYQGVIPNNHGSAY